MSSTSSATDISTEQAARVLIVYLEKYTHLLRSMNIKLPTGILGTSIFLKASPEVTAACRTGLLKVSSGDTYHLTPKGLLKASELRLTPEIVDWNELKVGSWRECRLSAKPATEDIE